MNPHQILIPILSNSIRPSKSKPFHTLAMVFASKMGPWLSDVGEAIKRSIVPDSRCSAPIEILAFETAKTMSRLLSLYKSLHESHVAKLKNDIIKSQGILFLNSSDEGYLLSLACTEMIEDLDKSAATVARLGSKCSDFGLNNFDAVYTDLKMGIIDYGKLEYGSKETERIVEKMERLVSATASLYSSLEALSELEVSERRLKILKQKTQGANYEHFEQKIAYQRKTVKHFRETSMWSKTYDKCTGMLARILFISYARIYEVFGPHVLLSMPPHATHRNLRSGPISGTPKTTLVRFHSQKSTLFLLEDSGRVYHAAGPATLGGCGLALRYANVILLANKYLDSAMTISEDARGNLYQMLPENLKLLLRSKLKAKSMKVTSEKGDSILSSGWREALMEMLKWLVPLARDTVTWEEKKSFDKMKFDSKTSVLLMHTLHFADKDKAESAIAEVLVGLSFVFKCENRRICAGDGSRCGDREAVLDGRCSFDGVCWS